MKEERGSWYLLTGLLIGIAIGLGYAWVVQPVRYINTSPASLRADFKDRYRALIAAAYASNKDLVRAKARLALLKDADVFQALSEQAQRTLAKGGSNDEVSALGLLALSLGQVPPGPAAAITNSPATVTRAVVPRTRAVSATPLSTPTSTSIPTVIPTETVSDTLVGLSLVVNTQVARPSATFTLPPSPSLTNTPLPRRTNTPTPTPVASSTPGGPFVLSKRLQICDQELDKPLIEIQAASLFGQPVPGVLVIVSSTGGEQRFYTGLKPEKGAGYADFIPEQGVSYTIRLGEGGQPVSELTALECQRLGGGTFWGAWLLKFVQP